MSILKKRWYFVLAAVVILLASIGVYVSITAPQPTEPKVVYMMPERSSDNPKPINSGGIALTESAPSVEGEAAAEPLSNQIPSDTESVESCCPEESGDLSQFDGTASDTARTHSNMVTLSPEMIADAESHQAYWGALERYFEKYDALKIEREALRMELESLIPDDLDDLLSLTAEQKKELHAKVTQFLVRHAAMGEKSIALEKEYPIRPDNTHSH